MTLYSLDCTSLPSSLRSAISKSPEMAKSNQTDITFLIFQKATERQVSRSWGM